VLGGDGGPLGDETLEKTLERLERKEIEYLKLVTSLFSKTNYEISCSKPLLSHASNIFNTIKVPFVLT
jgi:hypothetical protein